jgi:uncharacterized repeat protein (TIGR03803 family)
MRTWFRSSLDLGLAIALTVSVPLCAQTPTFQNLHSFDPPPASNPTGALIADASGNLFGTTANGGAFGFGTIFELDAAHGYAVRIIHAFQPPDGAFPQGGLIADPDGFLYGSTCCGGASGLGNVFRLDPSKGYALTTLHEFTASEGFGPTGELLRDASGNLYGATKTGGAHNHGTVFRLDAANAYALTTLHSFTGADGAEPLAGVIADPEGNLYGTTSAGGPAGSTYGTVFRLAAASGYALTTLHAFQGTDGWSPQSALTIDLAGSLYGTTIGGGPVGAPYGIVFKLDSSNAYAITTIHTFQGFDGAHPQATLIIDASGSLYGTTRSGGVFGLYGWGTIFKLDAGSAYALTTLHSFNYEDGAGPDASLLTDASGNLYGTTVEGGVGGGAPGYYGTVFRLDAASGYAITTLVRFGATDGAKPQGALIADGSGNLYGTTSEGGEHGFGSVYRVSPANGYVLTTLHSFVITDGALPRAALLMDGSGNLYGTTGGGGAIGSEYGTVFKLDASSGYALTTLHDFDHGDGSGPIGALIVDALGNLFGTTNDGGPGGAFASGTVFELDASNGYALITLHAFSYADGAYPSSALILDSAGNLYGTTPSGGASQYYGTVFKLDAANGYALTTLHEFDGVDGSEPLGALIADAAGNLYGTTYGNGVLDYGTVFKLDASNGYALTTLHRFASSDGAYPSAALLADPAGNLFGTTVGGGSSLKGTVFELDGANGYALTTLHSFASIDGASPAASLFADGGGNLYGTAQDGGAGGAGVVFRIGTAIPVSLSGIAPSSGPAAGFTPVVVTGTGLLPGSSLLIGAVDAMGTTVIDQGRIAAATPALTPGTLNDVTVTDSGDSSSLTLADAFFADFTDVAQGLSFHDHVERIFRAGITAGCGGGNYCPGSSVSRQQMAVFLLKAEHGSSYTPPVCHGIFDDVPCPSTYANWIEQLSAEGITAGCGGNDFCPASPVTRQQMAVFLLKTEHGSAYAPPTCTGIFDDVVCPGPFTDWIEQLYAELITGGCQASPLLYCPGSPVNRGQMAVFLVKTFPLP